MKFAVFDTEDNAPDLQKAGKSGFNKRVLQIAAKTSTGVEYYSKGDVDGFLKWLRKQKVEHAWAHNMQYDLGNLFGDSLDEIDATTIGSRIIRANWQDVEFRDSLNIWVCRVKDLGEAFDLPKFETDVRSRKYVMRDVDIVLKALKFLLAMCREYNLERMPCTLGGLAIRIWKAIGGENWHCDWPFCREALFGGRVELFQRVARGNLYWTDINSLYPHCMTFAYPTGAEDMRDIEGFGVAGVTIRVPEGFIMPLPVRTEDDSVIYPHGKLQGIWTFHEIRNAIEHGAKLIKIHDAVGSKTGAPYYRDYVERFYELRKNCKDKAKKLFYKLLLNNLYGQLATRGIITKTVPLHDSRLKSGAKTFGKKAFLDMRTSIPTHVNYLHAAYVTSYGRLELFKYLHALGDRAIYCDTDSVIFKGKPDFEIGDGLGQMKLVARGNYCETFAPKTYVFDEDYVAKGVPKIHAKTFIKTGEAKYFQPFKYREACEFFDRGNKKKLSVWREVKKRKLTNYTKKTLRKGLFWPKDIDAYTKECDK